MNDIRTVIICILLLWCWILTTCYVDKNTLKSQTIKESLDYQELKDEIRRIKKYDGIVNNNFGAFYFYVNKIIESNKELKDHTDRLAKAYQNLQYQVDVMSSKDKK